MSVRKRILFLCTGNSCRSQMAEGFGKKIFPEGTEVFSAGTKKHGLNPHAVAAMAEIGIDISSHTSKTPEEIGPLDFDLVVTVCDNARESCPVLPGASETIHRSFDDPPRLAEKETTEEGRMRHYRRVRDEIEFFVRELKVEYF